MSEFPEADTIRILVATDNHVGYEERDSIRKDDSWKSFDEIMTLARTQDVDMVLLSGDLFHDNKPSRKSMYQVIRTLRKNCLGMKPCELEFLSDAAEVFEGAFPHVNYEDPDINISIPVFSIHGNHDDPSGDGHFCSLDLLQCAGLVNYFGRIAEADNIEAKPILLQKGSTKLALYGLSNVRDERMFRTFRDHKVKWFRPNVQQSDWFNIAALHQNHHAHTATSYLPENVLPDWLDLVVWGHEHECEIDPKKNPETGFHVMQPGSSVATSLVPGEAVPKHVAVVSVMGKQFKVDKLPLRTVRPFVTRDIVLATDPRFKALDKKKENRQELTRRLMEVVDEMIDQAKAEWRELHGEDDESVEPPLPLIRLKVEYTAPEGGKFDCENPQRFSNRFVGRVANTNDVVYFWRKKTAASRNGKHEAAEMPESAALDINDGSIKVDVLVSSFLAAQSLKILPQAPFGDAVSQFVTKDDKHAMESFVSESLAGQVKQMLDLDSDEGEDLDAAMEEYRKKLDDQFIAGQLRFGARKRVLRPAPEDWDSDLDGHWELQPDAFEEVTQPPATAPTTAKPPPKRRANTQRTQPEDNDIMEIDDDEEEEQIPTRSRQTKPPAKKPTRKTTTKPPPRTTTRARKPALYLDESESDGINSENTTEPPPTRTQPARRTTTRTRGKSTAPATRGGSKRQTTLSFSQTSRGREVSADEISDDGFEPR